MSGRESLRGYLVQTMAALIDALCTDNDWVALSLEPLHESEKVDIKWQYADHTKVVQIKSSKNPFSQKQIKLWCSELVDSTKADQYELVLIGNLSRASVEINNVNNVKIPPPLPLNIEGMVKALSHDLSVYCSLHGLPPVLPQVWRILTGALICNLEIESIYGQWFTRDNFNDLLKEWILGLLPRITDINPSIDLNLLMEVLHECLYQPEPWIQRLSLLDMQHINDSHYQGIDFSGAINKSKKFILIGNSGTGKTTLLRTVSMEMNNDPKNLNLWIPLRTYSNSLEKTIKNLLGWHDLPDEKVIQTLENLQITLLLDGLNEVSESERRNCVNEITLLLHSYHGPMCITFPLTDIAIYGFDCPIYKMSDLTTSQIEQTIKSFFTSKGNPDKSIWFLQTVRAWDSEKLNEFDLLAKVPLNLQFILELVETDNFEFYGLRDLYSQVIQKRLERTKQLYQKGQISVDLKTESLKRLAYRSLIDKKPLRLQRAYIQATFESLFNISESVIALEEIVRAGLLIELNEFLLEWPHPSFRDYLAGRKIFDLIERDESFDPFPLESIDTVGAVAHATRLITTQSQDLANRPKIFLALLKRNPSFEVMKTVAEEYHTALNCLISNQQSLEYDLDEFKGTRWGERFLETYQLIKNIAIQNGFIAADKIPSPTGLVVFLDNETGFCGVLFTGNNIITYDQLNNFPSWVSKSRKRKKACSGFCIFAPFLRLLDPEIVAYLQVGLWLRLFSKDHTNRVDNWHNNLTTYINPNNEWMEWSQSSDLLTPTYALCASPEQTMQFLIKKFGVAMVNQLKTISDIIYWSKNEFLSWQEIFMPITFRIDPIKTQDPPSNVSNRVGQVMVITPPSNDTSLILLMPFSPKIDFGINIKVPFPIPFFNRYYFLYYESMQGFSGVSLVHLRG